MGNLLHDRKEKFPGGRFEPWSCVESMKQKKVWEDVDPRGRGAIVGSTSWTMAEKMQYYFRTSFFERNFTMTFRLQRTEGEVLIIVRNYLWLSVLKQRQSYPLWLREIIWGSGVVAPLILSVLEGSGRRHAPPPFFSRRVLERIVPDIWKGAFICRSCRRIFLRSLLCCYDIWTPTKRPLPYKRTGVLISP